MTAPQDWYALLGVAREASESDIADAVERRSRQATALATTAPERSQSLRDQVRAMKRDLLSGEQARRAYDCTLAGVAVVPDPPTPQASPQEAEDREPADRPVEEPPPFWVQQAPIATPSPSPTTPAGGWESVREHPPAQTGYPAHAAHPAYPAHPVNAAPAGHAPPPYPGPRPAGRLSQFVRSAFVCRRCQAIAEPSDRFCTHCGDNLKPIRAYTPWYGPLSSALDCPYCGWRAAPHHYFCRNCGAQRPRTEGTAP